MHCTLVTKHESSAQCTSFSSFRILDRVARTWEISNVHHLCRCVHLKSENYKCGAVVSAFHCTLHVHSTLSIVLISYAVGAHNI